MVGVIGGEVLEVRDLTKRYPAKTAVDAVSFTIQPGEILGYLGPNGSGKSTTVNMVVGLLEPTSGSISLFDRSLDRDPEEYKRHLGYVPEEPHLYTHLTPDEYLTLVGRLRGLPKMSLKTRVTELIRLFDLWDSRYQAMSSFSKGMRQRVLLSAALLHDPRLLVLDEPFSGLDVTAALLFQTLLRLFVQQGRMVLFSSHRLDVVEGLCSQVVILRAGRIAAYDSISTLRETAGSRSLAAVFARVTEQMDFSHVAEAILRTVQS
jgi:ABC-2 type transport system ATP-binding protein